MGFNFLFFVFFPKALLRCSVCILGLALFQKAVYSSTCTEWEVSCMWETMPFSVFPWSWASPCTCMCLLLLLLLSRFSRVQLCATPETAAHQAPPSLGFSRQEHWSGLPFPSPMHESEKWKWNRSAMSDPQQPHGLQPSRLVHPWDFPGKSTGVGCHCLS